MIYRWKDEGILKSKWEAILAPDGFWWVRVMFQVNKFVGCSGYHYIGSVMKPTNPRYNLVDYTEFPFKGDKDLIEHIVKAHNASLEFTD